MICYLHHVPSLEPRRALYEDVRDWIATQIAERTFAPGERLVETRIAKELGVSQGVVREALRELGVLRLVTTVPNRGALVRIATAREVAEAHELRAVIEGFAAGRAVANGLDVAGLDELVDDMDRAADAGSTDDYAKTSEAFHRQVVAAADHDLLATMWESLLVASRTTFEATGATLDLPSAARSHRVLIDAFRSGDVARIEQASREHADQFCTEDPT
jgi:DNA-binding GntR family transcriptional regulator